jgi:hypothetical protein
MRAEQNFVIKNFLFVVVILVFPNCFAVNTTFQEPIQREQDPWFELTNELVQNAKMDADSFSFLLPLLSQEIAQLPQLPMWLELWGTSFNVENGKWIVPPHFIKIMSDFTCEKVMQNEDVYHAGLLHTYGYLFSNLKTPYGCDISLT